MNLDAPALRLEANGSIIVRLFDGVAPEEAEWKGVSLDTATPTAKAPADSDVVGRWSIEERWSLLQIARHLVVEERDDFRARLSTLLRNPHDPFPSFEWPFGSEDDPARKLDLESVVAIFGTERAASFRWLRTVGRIDPDIVHCNPPEGTRAFRAGDLVAAWIAHDYYHIRQIANLRWVYLEHTSAPYTSEYAGPFYDTTA